MRSRMWPRPGCSATAPRPERGAPPRPASSSSAVLLDSACAGWCRCRGDGVVDEDGCDGGGGGERFGVEDSAACRGAVQEQRQLLAQLFGVGGAGLAGGF